MELNVLVSMMSAPASRYMLVNVPDDVRLGQAEQVVVAAQLARPALEAPAAEGGLVQLAGLDHGAHGAVEQDDAFPEQLFQRPGEVRWHDVVHIQNQSGLKIACLTNKSIYLDMKICSLSGARLTTRDCRRVFGRGPFIPCA